MSYILTELKRGKNEQGAEPLGPAVGEDLDE